MSGDRAPLLDVVAIGDSFVPARTFRTALEQAGVPIALRTAEVDESVRWTPEPGDPVLREFAGSPDEIVEHAAGADVLLVHVAPVTRRVLDALPGLRMLGVARGGPVNVDLAAASERGVPVVTTPGRNATAVAELTIALAITALRKVPAAQAFARTSGVLGASAIEGAPFVGRELGEVAVGLVGFGAVGRHVARLARAFGARVLVSDPYVDAATVTSEGCQPCTLRELLARADVVSLHVRAAPETENLIDARALKTMRDRAVLINTARESVLDEEAVLEALEDGKLSCVAVDVVRPSPSTPHPLAAHPAAIVLPHVGGATVRAGMDGALRLGRAVAALARGDDLPDVVNHDQLQEAR